MTSRNRQRSTDSHKVNPIHLSDLETVYTFGFELCLAAVVVVDVEDELVEVLDDELEEVLVDDP